MATPTQRISRLLEEGARFMVELPGHVAIDLTPDVIAAMEEVQTGPNKSGRSRNLLKTDAQGGDVPTLVEFT